MWQSGTSCKKLQNRIENKKRSIQENSENKDKKYNDREIGFSEGSE